jgi:hypothetical protein
MQKEVSFFTPYISIEFMDYRRVVLQRGIYTLSHFQTLKINSHHLSFVLAKSKTSGTCLLLSFVLC